MTTIRTLGLGASPAPLAGASAYIFTLIISDNVGIDPASLATAS